MAHIWRVTPELEREDHALARYAAAQGQTVIVHEHRHDDACRPEDGMHTCLDACTGRGHWRYQGTEVSKVSHQEAKLHLTGVALA